MKHTILIFSQAMELGGVERSLLGLLDSIDYDRYDVDLFLMRYSGELMPYLNPKGKAPAGDSAVRLAGCAHGVARQEWTAGRAMRAAEWQACRETL